MKILKFLVVTVPVFLLVALMSGQSAADTIHTATYNNHTYYLLDTDGTKWWHEAEAEAVSLGGHLVTINDAAENQWVFETFEPVAIDYASENGLTGKISLWIGFFDEQQEGNYEWVSGEAVTYTNWISGEPGGGSADEDFAGMVVNSWWINGGWHDIVGNNRWSDLPFGVVEVVNVISVSIDVKPGSDPNCFNINGHGVIPVAILGSDAFDVTNIDYASLLFGGLEVRIRGKKGPLCGTEYSNGDAYLDLVCHFEDDADNWMPGSETATLTGTLFDGSEFEGSNSICVVP